MYKKLSNRGITISGITYDNFVNRGEGICNYLNAHEDVDDFVILDDRTFDFENYSKLWDRLLITDGIEKAKYASKTPQVETIIFLEYIKEYSAD